MPTSSVLVRPPASIDQAAEQRRGTHRRGRRRAKIARRSWHAESDRVMTTGQRWQWAAFAATWLAALTWFWTWWLQTDHVANPVLYWLFSVPMFYVAAVLPSFYLFYLFHMRRPRPANTKRARETGVVGRVAVITLTVPGSESLEIVRRQLESIVAIEAEHDSWILVDKVHSPQIEELAQRYGVRYFCRHDVERWGAAKVAFWNQDGPPYQAKTKAGNVNAWLEAYGADYSHFTQLDIDHNPQPRYLDAVLGYFESPEVAWVQAPSVYSNLREWAARGSAEQELVLQGPLQMGFYGFCSTPFIIGSHCTYDTAAVAEIGGFQPTRAEDHLDTVLLAARGYRGVFLPEVIAQGDGPETFDAYLSQQFAWAYSMIQVLFQWTPRLLRNYSPRQALQFLFVQTWYTFWSVSMLALFSVPVVSLFADAPVSHTSLGGFLAHSVPVGVTATAAWYWSRRWHKPHMVTLSWRGVLLHVARWLIVLSALVQVIFRVSKPYMITVKGMQDARPQALPVRVVAPYIAVILASLGACGLFLRRDGSSAVQGALFFTLDGAALFLVLVATVFAQDYRSLRARGLSAGVALRLGSACWATWLLLAGGFCVTAAYSAPMILRAVGLT